jgi:hypothetical protein
LSAGISSREEVLIQDFVNHDGLIYKIYCLGKTVMTQKRPSIPNITVDNFKFKEVGGVSSRDKWLGVLHLQLLIEFRGSSQAMPEESA